MPGPIDLTPFRPLVDGLGFYLLAVYLTALALVAFRWQATRRARAWALAALLAPLVLWVGLGVAAQVSWHQRKQVAEARFKERCKLAKMVVYRKVGRQERLAVVEPYSKIEFIEQFSPDVRVISHILSERGGMQLLLTGRRLLGQDQASGTAVSEQGVEVLEAINSSQEQVTEYRRLPVRGDPKWNVGEVVKAQTSSAKAAYAVRWERLDDQSDREQWVAGERLWIEHRQTGEVVAEWIDFMQDPALGSVAGARSPWSFARGNCCLQAKYGPNRDFRITEALAWIDDVFGLER